MVVRFLKKVYGDSTHGTRGLNLAVHLLWTCLLTMTLSGWFVVSIPIEYAPKPYQVPDLTTLVGLSFTTVVLTIISYIPSDWRILFKNISLLFGTITQILIAAIYGTTYPPFDVMVLVCSLLAFWFAGAALQTQRERIRHDENIDSMESPKPLRSND